jgi:hypothetical protein
MDEQRKYAILFAATILAARKLDDIGNNSFNKRSAGIRAGCCGFPARSGGTSGWME